MSKAHPSAYAGRAFQCENDHGTGLGAAHWLSLAAAPTFAGMALLTAAFGGDHQNILCAAAQHAFPLAGMAPMYWLMSAFHLAPWLKLVSRSRRS